MKLFCIIFAVLAVVQGRRQPRIVGGDIVNIEEAPFNLALEYRGLHICGGAALAPRWTVTAAHCFGRSFNASRARIRAGSSARGQGGTEHAVQTIIKHPSFLFDIVDYDVALIEVDPPFEFSAALRPTPLAAARAPLPGELLTVFGWGFTKETGNPSPHLRAVRLPLFPHDECVALYRTTLNVTAQMLCAGYRDGGRDACILDSGGPLTWNGTLQGVVSWGWGCARAMRPGVFTDVGAPAVRGWIEQTMQAYQTQRHLSNLQLS